VAARSKVAAIRHMLSVVTISSDTNSMGTLVKIQKYGSPVSSRYRPARSR